MIELARVAYLTAERPGGGLSNMDHVAYADASDYEIHRILLDDRRRVVLIEPSHGGYITVVPLEKVTLCYATLGTSLAYFENSE